MFDALSIPGIFLVIAASLLVAFEVGFRIGRWWQRHTPEEKEGPTGMLVGSLLALMAFLLAVTMSMASDRFDSRRALVLDEANAIGTTYLRAGYLPEPQSTEARTLLREYVGLRINVADDATRAAHFKRSTEIQNQLWGSAEGLARQQPDSDVLALYIDALNGMIDLHEERLTAIEYARVPSTILLTLFALAALSLGMVGYSAGLTRHRSALSATVLALVLASVLTLVVDLDRPRDGFLQVSQQPLIDLQEQLAQP
jgi:hypothetical protein